MKKTIPIIIAILILIVGNNCSAPLPIEDNPAPSVPAEDYGKAEAVLRSMSLEEKVGQLLIVGIPKDSNKETIEYYTDHLKIAGFILFSRNYKDFESQYNLVKSLKESNSQKNPLPLFISVDEEGGSVSRLPKGGTHFPDAQLVGKSGDPSLTRATGEVIGKELMASGINMNFAPVLDIVSGENKLMAKRSYGSTADAVSMHGISFISGLKSTGVIACPKHFPGHGSTGIDSHKKLPIISIDNATMQNRELVPFKNAIEIGGVDALMAGHIAFPEQDPSGLPATMSGYFLTDLLRRQMNFTGIVISDDIEMSGYGNSASSLEECTVISFNAGIDVFLIGHTGEIQEKVFNALTEACKDGRIPEERLNEAVLRIIDVKHKYNLSDTMKYDFEEAKKIFGSKGHKAIQRELNIQGI